ncbi:MAG TPA: dienelactone hydrolase family protein [Planctomycetota bacterium]|nr:dienelactone hydrolase family protein [Planctomycetota bacterium]
MKPQSFVDFLDAYGEACPPSMVYREGEEFAAWQRRFREKVLSLLGPVPERVTPQVEVVETVAAEGHTRHVLRVPVTRFSTLVAYLLVPSDLRPGERRPGLVASHGHARHGMDSVCGLRAGDDGPAGPEAYALRAVREGYVVLAPAWWGWHGRDGHLPVAGTGRDKCNVIQMAAGMYGLNVIALHVQDGQAALDALAARPEVDPARLGCIGNSYGGRTAMWLALADPRIKACVASGCMNHFRERSLKLSSCGIQYPFGLLRYGDVPELFALIAPRPMQLQAGEKDGLITPADRDHIAATVRRAYQLLGAEANLDYALHPGGHCLDWALAAPFLAAHLRRQGEP